MATERIISPGVFTNENDLSFLPAGIAAIGAAFVGPTLKGPAGVPMQVTSYQDYQIMFGGEDSSQTYIPYAVKNYLRNASSAMVVRILGDGGWSFTTTTNKLAALAGATINSGSSTTQFRIISGFHPAKNDASANLDARASTAVSGNIATSFTVTLSGSGVPAIVKSLSINPQRTDYITKVLGTSPDATKISNTNYSNGFYSYVNFQNYSENLALSVGEVTVVTGSTVISQSMGTTNVSMNAVYSTAQSRIASGSLSTSIANWNLLSISSFSYM
jgi:hypothetical protein